MMRLAVSTIAWDPPEHAAVLALLAGAGVAGIEVAPTKIWPDWQGATPDAAARLRDDLASRGFAVPALQSILFGRPGLHVFGDADSRAGLIAHVAMVARLAGALGAGVMVFGSPRNRLRGPLAPAAALQAAVPLFRAIGDACAAAGTALGIEANPPQYGGDWLLRWTEAAELVAAVDHPGVVLHLDTACTAMAGDDPAAAAASCAIRLGHFHASAPQLGPVAPDGFIDHAAVAAALRAGGYRGWVSLEMRRADDPLTAISTAVDHLRACYG